MCSNISGSETDVEAILHIAKKIREEIDYNEGEPLETQFLGLVLQKCPLHVDRFIRREYRSICNFLKTHCEVFWFDHSRKKLRVTVASRLEVSNYISFLKIDGAQKPLKQLEGPLLKVSLHAKYAVSKAGANGTDTYKSLLSAFDKRERLSRELTNGKGISQREKEAIIYFSNIMRASASKNCSNIVTMKEFEEICRAAPCYIQDFVSNEFESLVFITNFDNFIKRHHQIFPETKSGRSIRVKPPTKVSEYIAGLLNYVEGSNYNHLTGVAAEPSHLQEFEIPTPNVPPTLNDTTDAKTTTSEPFPRFDVWKPFNLQDLVNPALRVTNSANEVPLTQNDTIANDTSKEEKIKAQSKTAGQSDHFEELCSQLKAQIQHTIIEKKSKSCLDFSSFRQKSGFNVTFKPPIEPDDNDITFVEANYAYDDLLQDLFSKTILNSASDSHENSERNGVNRNIECQTVSSGRIFHTQLYQ